MKVISCAVAMMICCQLSLAQEIKWPRIHEQNNDQLIVYQPQVDHWDKHSHLEFRSAVSYRANGKPEVLGIMYVSARTDVDMDSHKVKIDSFRIRNIHFVSIPADSNSYYSSKIGVFFRQDESLVMSLEQIVACIEHVQADSSLRFNTSVPPIFVSRKTAVVLQTDGELQKAETGKEDLAYVINANLPVFFDGKGKTFFLFDGWGWRKGPRISGPWTTTDVLPPALFQLSADSNWAYLKSVLPGKTAARDTVPEVFYASTMAELISFSGEPVFKSIPSTSLKYASNTSSDVFFCGADKYYYYMSAGRWFRSAALTGPWTFATDKLPKDFQNIPVGGVKEEILAYVPGTDQAKDMALIAQIPVVAKVNMAEAEKQVKIVYQGEPQFKPIDSTGLYYAVNTADKVIKVSSNSYYACVSGVWFTAAAPGGPWKTATSIPAAIYSIPPSSPVYNVTYVTQTVVSPTYVQSSYTAGYMGTYVAATPFGVTVMVGTGFYHPPYIYYPPYGYPVCYHYYPATYGVYAYRPYPYGGVSYRASYNPYTGTYARSASAFGPYGSVTAAQAYNPYTGTYARGMSSSSPYGTRTVAQAYNPYTGRAAETRQNSSAYGQWGSTTVANANGDWARAGHATNAQGTVAGIQTSGGGQAVGVSGSNANRGAIGRTGSGDVYAAANGNVYKKTENGWNQYQNGGWSSASTPSQQPRAQQAQNNATARYGNAGGGAYGTQQMNREMQNRERGNYQAQQFGNRAGGAGAFRGGGRRR